MAGSWNTDAPDTLTATSYTRDYSAQGVFSDITTGATDNFTEEPEYINNYGRNGWKVYKVIITIEPAEQQF